MKVKITTYIILIFVVFFYACRTNRNISKESIEIIDKRKKLLYKALSTYYEHLYETNGKDRLSDTLILNPYVYKHGYYNLGLDKMNFYFGYIDTTTFSNMRKGKDQLPYYRQIQNNVYDTIYLDQNVLYVKDDSITLVYPDLKNGLGRRKRWTSITPTTYYKKDHLAFEILHEDGFQRIYLKNENENLIYDTIYYFDSSFDWGRSDYFHHDTLLTIDFDSLYKKYGLDTMSKF